MKVNIKGVYTNEQEELTNKQIKEYIKEIEDSINKDKKKEE